MSRRSRRKNGRMIHGNVQVNSSPDVVALGKALEERFINLCGMHEKATGVHLFPPAELDRDMLNWRTMRLRHKRGDHRHTNAEFQSVKALCEWTLVVKARLCNQPVPKVNWGD
jgi:hypothetical protein